MRVRRVLIPLLALSLAVPACNRGQDAKQLAARKPAPAAPSPRVTGTETAKAVSPTDALNAALASLYPASAGQDTASLDGSWERDVAMGDMPSLPYTYEVCLHEREGGLDLIAVCGSTDEGGHVTPGLIELFAFRSGAGTAHVAASEREITSNGFGSPQEPKWLQTGPQRHVIVVSSGYTSTGQTTSDDFWYSMQGSEFGIELGLPSYNAYEPACSEAEGCRPYQRSCDATIQTGKAADAWGRWPVLIEASVRIGEGPEHTRTMLLKSDAKGYQFSAEAATQLSCINT